MVVLRLGPAIAVLRADVRSGRDEHDRVATNDLRLASGRQDIVVERRPSGRPRLAAPYAELGISLSYRDGLLLAGFDPHEPVGVDLEPGEAVPTLDVRRLAVDHFAPGEAMAVAARAVNQAADLFWRLWVAKEAVLKLTGRGVYDGLRRPDLSGCIAGISCDGTPVRIPASPSHPAVELAVVRSTVGCFSPYCALAQKCDP